MSLHGLLDAVVKDAALAEAVKAATDGNRMQITWSARPPPAPSRWRPWPATPAAPYWP